MLGTQPLEVSRAELHALGAAPGAATLAFGFTAFLSGGDHESFVLTALSTGTSERAPFLAPATPWARP